MTTNWALFASGEPDKSEENSSMNAPVNVPSSYRHGTKRSEKNVRISSVRKVSDVYLGECRRYELRNVFRESSNMS